MQSERQSGPCRPVSEVVQRIIGRSGLSQLMNRNSNPPPESATPTSVHQEMAHTFPSMYSAPGPSRSLSSYPIRGTPYGRQRGYIPRPPKNFLKRIVLVNPDVAIVPKGKVRQQLHDDGCICDMMEFNGSWDEEAVMKSLVEAFDAVLDQNAPAPKIRIMKACGGLLKIPHVPAGHKWTAPTIKAISNNGDLYIQATSPLKRLGVDHPEQSPVFSVPTPLEFNDDVMEEVEREPTTIPQSTAPTTSTSRSNSTSPLTLTSHGSSSALSAQISATASSLSDIPDDLMSLSIAQVIPASNSDETACSHKDPDVAIIMDIFPGMSEVEAYHLISEHGLEDAILRLSETSNEQSYDHTSLPTVLSQYARSVTVSDRDFYLTLKRDEIWPRGCQFYKAAKVDKKRLRWNLVIEYETEEGIDAGTAIKGDFFCEFLNQIDQRLFEGSAYRRVPKKDIGLESLFELAGIMMVHSVIHGGPSFSRMSPLVHAFLMNGRIDEAVQASISNVSVADIPHNASTDTVIKLINMIDQAANDEALDVILDDRENMAIINCSRWPITKAVTMNTKTELVQILLVEELLNKRLDNIRAMKRGLMVLGFADMCRTNIDLTSSLFLHIPREFLAVDFLNLVSKQPPLTPKQHDTYRWFVKFVQERETVPTAATLVEQGAVASLPLLLRFVTGHISVPPMGLSKPIKIHYFRDDRLLPEAECCFNMLKLPTAHSTKETFFESMDNGILMSGQHFYRE